jgi:hypothetical protein
LRFIGLDIHRDFCDVAIYENGRVRSAGRVASSPELLQVFAQSLCPDDHVALETTGNALGIARILEPHVGGVLVADTRNVRAMTHAKVKNDRVDAQLLAKLLAAGMLPGTWVCDERPGSCGAGSLGARNSSEAAPGHATRSTRSRSETSPAARR